MKDMTELSRRRFLQSAVTTASVASVPVALTGCFGDDDDNNSGNSEQPDVVDTPVVTDVAFGHGVASGDPLADAVIIWTRATPVDGTVTTAVVSYTVSRTQAMDDVVAEGTLETDAARDFTVKIDVTGLTADTHYYYQFGGASNVVSTVGKTKTLPTGAVDKVTMAVCSCSNFPAGLFNVYKEIANSDADVVLHLGDYIYEYGSNEYPTADFDGRQPEPVAEIVSLEQYRARYAQYHADANLQVAHAAMPFICIWDDHEVANDTYKDGAENHTEGEAEEGLFTERRDAAFQAYHEWLPIRTGTDKSKIYRRFDFGDLIRLHMLDTRMLARDKQLAYADYIDASNGVLDAAAFQADLANPSRTLIGADQRGWMSEGMRSSTAVWDVLGQQILMGRMNIPAELLTQLAIVAGTSGVTQQQAQAALGVALTELATIKARLGLGDPTVTDEERARVAPNAAAPYNLDAWDGYFVAREQVLATSMLHDRNLVVLAGDTHNAWASDLYPFDMTTGAVNRTQSVGVEFATQSVSSPGLEEYAGFGDNEELQAGFESAITVLIDDLKYLNAGQRGFMKVTFTPESANCDWIFVSSITSENYTVSTGKSMRTLPGESHRKLETVVS